MKTIIKITSTLVGLIALYFIFMTVTDYKPKEIISLTADQTITNSITKDSIQVTTFNIGYATLDESADFF